MPEQLREPAVDFLGEIRGLRQQLAGRPGEEPRVGAQKLQERGEITLERHLCNDGVHFGADALHLAEPDFVYLRRRQVNGGVTANLFAIEAIAPRQVGCAEGGAGAGFVLVVVELEQTREGWYHFFADRLPRIGLQGFPALRVEVFGALKERLVEGAELGILHQLRPDRLVPPRQDDPWLGHAGLDTGSHQADVLVHGPGDLPQARDVVRVVGLF